jgi:hypothetical protein
MNYQDQINELKKLLEKKEVQNEVIPDHHSLNNKIFEKKITYKERWFWSAVIFLVTLIPFIYHYTTQSEWTAVTFGFFVCGLMIPILLFIDVKFTNGDSFDKISESGIALAIAFFALVVLFVGSLQYGERFSPERIKGEALQRIESQIGEIQNRLNTEAPKNDVDSSWDEGATR